MSLAQHVTQTDGHDYEGPAGVKGPEGDEERASLLWSPQNGTDDVPEDSKISEWRRLNYAPVDLLTDEPQQRDAAYNVSNLKRAGKAGNMA